MAQPHAEPNEKQKDERDRNPLVVLHMGGDCPSQIG